jgi:hypothetical protein
MRIPDANIKQFQSLYKTVLGIDIDTEEAQKQGLAVMRLVAIKQEKKLLNKEKSDEQSSPTRDNTERSQSGVVPNNQTR